MAVAWGDPYDLPFVTEVLDNGLTVLVRTDLRSDSVAIYLWYDVGSGDEGPSERGYAHLFEHMMFGGSANVPAGSFSRQLTQAGGMFGGGTTRDATFLWDLVQSGALDLALFLESDRMGWFVEGITPDRIDSDRRVVLAERFSRFSPPGGRSPDAVSLATRPPEHPYHAPVNGAIADLDAATPERLAAFWETHHRPSNAVLTITGAVETDVALERVRYWFGDVPDRGPPAPRPSTVPAFIGGSDRLLLDRIAQPELHLAWEGLPLGDEDEHAQRLLAAVLSERLARLTWGRQASTASASAIVDRLDGQIRVRISADQAPLPALERAALRQVRRLTRRRPRAAELERARHRALGPLREIPDRPQSVAYNAASCFAATGDANGLPITVATLEAVTRDDLWRVARQRFVDKPHTTVSVVAPGHEEEALPGATLLELQ